MNVIGRIMGSKKFLEAMVPNMIGLAAVWGLELPANTETMIVARAWAPFRWSS